MVMRRSWRIKRGKTKREDRRFTSCTGKRKGIKKGDPTGRGCKRERRIKNSSVNVPKEEKAVHVLTNGRGKRGTAPKELESGRWKERGDPRQGIFERGERGSHSEDLLNREWGGGGGF